MKCEFVVGQKVVAVVRGSWSRGLFQVLRGWVLGTRDPAFGEVCQINRIRSEYGRVYLNLVGYQGWCYDWRCFRPIIERKTNISVFETLLADINAGKVKPVVVPA